MDDINFEELDQAVNSVLQQPSGHSSRTAPADDSSTTNPVEPDPVVPEPKVTAQPILPKRRGQFMDMVHPSSDMTTPNTSAQRPLFPSRQTGTLQPLNPAIVETVPAPVDDSSDMQSTPEEAPEEASKEVPEEAAPVAAEAVADADAEAEAEDVQPAEWPDPLDDFDKTEQEDDVQTPPDTNSDALGQVAHIEAGFVGDNESEGHEESEVDEDTSSTGSSQGSPFIDGKEVEKRPLGAFAETSKDVADEPQPSTTMLASAPLPEELAPEIVSVESDNPPASAESVPDEPVVQDGISTSIPQQYRSVENSVDNDQNDSGHPVFDTKEYHQPLTPPAKSSRASQALRYLLAILFIIVFGIAAGYVIWAFKLL